MGKTAVIAGATGLVGSSLLQLLLADSAYSSVIAVGRRHTGEDHPKLVEKVMDLETPEKAIEGIGAGYDLFIATGTTIKQAGSQGAFRKVDFELPFRLAQAAAANGADMLAIVSSIGASSSSRYFYLQVKGELEEALQALGLKRVIVLRPSQLLGERRDQRPGEKWAAALAKPLSPLMRGPLARYRPVQAADVAAAMLAAAKRSQPGWTVLESEAIVASSRS